MSRPRVPHIMKKHKSNQMPSSYLFLDTETKTKPTPKLKHTERQVLNFGFAYAYRLESGRKTREQWCRFTDFKTFWTFLISRLDKVRPLYVFAHNLPFDLTIMDFWHWVERVNFKTEYFVLDDPPSFIIGRYEQKKVVFLDTLNYWRTSLAKIGESIGVKKLPFPHKTASHKQWDTYCKQDVQVLATAVERLIAYVDEHDLGQFGLSAASMALSTFKHRFMKHDIFVHDNRRALECERQSYYGGLVQCFYVGSISSHTLYKLDVNSMYPFVMRNNVPCKYLGYEREIPTWMVLNKLKHMGATAHVRIKSVDSVYPIRYNGRLCLCKGEYDTYLCGPELQRAIYAGSIDKVYYVSFYEMAPIFREYIDYFYAERLRFKKIGDDVSQYFVKLFMNMLYGKFGQLGYGSIELTSESLRAIYAEYGLAMPTIYDDEFNMYLGYQGQSSWHPKDLPRMLTLRKVNNKTMVKVKPGEHAESFPIIAGYITAYARELLLKYIKTAGERNTYYCDTDSLIVNDKGYYKLKLADYLSETELGKLKLEGTANESAFYCPKDYRFGSEEKRKGIRNDAVKKSESEFEQIQFEGVKSVLKRGYQAYIDIKTITKKVSREYNKGVVGKDGWVSPYSLPLAEPVLTPIVPTLIEI